ncbi:hypothetical protein [Undibacterium sp.]|uniref:hypothetical protein n=1 Tax=Undibacterium sp. TaxID=1914977 RepID=UPI002731A556|nr:hypothetical protein [Undibacterium sp.]MDP1977936.1 hypothetical protein [Undibacterium sp.]
MRKEEKPWFARPYESWRKESKSTTGRVEADVLFQNRLRRMFIVGSIVMSMSMLSMFWIISSDVVLWDRENASNFGFWMFVLSLIGSLSGLYLATKLPYGFYSLQIFAATMATVGVLGGTLLPLFLYANYILDFSEPEVIAVNVSDIKLVGNVGKRSHRFTFVMNQAPFETRSLLDQNRRYKHLKVGENALLVSGKGFFGLRYVREVRSN